MMSLRDAVDPDKRGNIVRFAERVGVSHVTAWRWTLPPDHPKHIVPRAKYWPAIEEATGYRWRAPYAAFNKPARAPRSLAINSQAARKAAATRRRRAAAA